MKWGLTMPRLMEQLLMWVSKYRGTMACGISTGADDYYIFIETSQPRKAGDVARLISPHVTGPHCCSFYYNLNGNHMAFVSVLIKTPERERMVWLKSKHRGDTWIKAKVNINEAGTFQVSCQVVWRILARCRDCFVFSVFYPSIVWRYPISIFFCFFSKSGGCCSFVEVPEAFSLGCWSGWARGRSERGVDLQQKLRKPNMQPLAVEFWIN